MKTMSASELGRNNIYNNWGLYRREPSNSRRTKFNQARGTVHLDIRGERSFGGSRLGTVTGADDDSGVVGATLLVTIAWICYIVGLLQPITFQPRAETRKPCFAIAAANRSVLLVVRRCR